MPDDSDHNRPPGFARLRKLPLVGRAADWGLGPSAVSKQTQEAGSRIAGLEVTESICPYCAVGCSQVVYTRGGELVDIEGNPRSPINQGTLCPKGSASRQLIQQPGRLTKVLYRRPYGTEWEELDLETGDGHDRRARDRRPRGRLAGHRRARASAWTARSASARSAARRSTTRRTTSSRRASRALGAVQIENQARI